MLILVDVIVLGGNLSKVYLVFFIDWNQDNDFDDPGEWVTTEGRPYS